MTTHPLRGWIPSKLYQVDNELMCRWQWVGEHRFDAPFFDETLQQCMREPQNSGPYRTVTTLDGLVELAQSVPAVSPSGFIFHVSRCGSTLLSQLLTLNDAHIVLSEVPLLDELLRLPERLATVTAVDQERYMRAALCLLGHRRTGNETHLFVKLDSWHIHFYSLLRQLFPTVPMILLYRAPDAVIASHRKQRGMHAVPGLLPPYLVGLKVEEIDWLNFDAYTAQVLSYYYTQFLSIAEVDPNTFLLAYQPDGLALMTSLAHHLGLPVSDVYWQAIQERSGFHAKRPQQVFNEEIPFTEAPDYLIAARSFFERLEDR